MSKYMSEYILCSGATGRAGSYVDIRLYANYTVDITGISPALALTQSASRPVQVRCYINNELVQTETVTVNSTEKRYYYIGLDLHAEAGSNIRIYINWPNGGATCYWSYLNQTFGWGNTVGSTECADMTLYVEQNTLWVTDGQNDGYPHPIGYDITEFEFFEKDEQGYPKNKGVWKLDNNNEGYPWITGFEIEPIGGDIYVIGMDKLMNTTVMVFDGHMLVPANLQHIFKG